MRKMKNALSIAFSKINSFLPTVFLKITEVLRKDFIRCAFLFYWRNIC